MQKSFLFPGCGARRWRGADFILSVKWLCAPRGPEAELVFSLSWFSLWWRGAGFFFWSNGFALRAGQSAFSFRLIVLFWCAKENLAQRKSALPRAQAREPFLVLFWHAKENLTS